MTNTVVIPSLRFAEADPSCAGCFFWSQWLQNTGDCLHYAMKRREAMFAGAAEIPPLRSAQATSAFQVCDDFQQQRKP